MNNKRTNTRENRQDEESLSALTWQQRVWQGAGTIFKSLGPLLLYLAVPALLMCVGMVLQKGRDKESITHFSGNFYYTLGVLVTFWILNRRSRKRGGSLWEEVTFSWEGSSSRRLWMLFGTGFGCSLLFSAVLTLLPLPGTWMAGYESAADGVGSGTDPLLALFTTMALVPVLEEIVFRGYMLNRLLEGFEERTAILISAGIFALCHVSGVWMVYAFVMGMFLAWVSVREDNILYSMALHMGFNASVLPLWLLNRSGMFDHAVSGSLLTLLIGGAGCLMAYYLCRQYRKEEFCD